MIQIKKTILTLVLLLTAATGAWAQQETLLTYVTATGQTTYSQTPDGVVTVSLNGIAYSDANYGWLYGGTVTVEAPQGYTITRCVFKSFDGTPLADNQTPFTATIVDGGEGSSYVSAETSDGQTNRYMDGIKFIEVYGYAAAPSGPEVAWDKDKNTGTFTMPGGNVTLEPEYYPQATLAFQGLTAAEDAAAKTEAPLAVVADGAVTGGTLMYYVATDKNFSQADAIALAETQWSADIPTAETIEAAGTYIMWYYIKGDAEHSDTDPIPLVVTLLPEPTYAVTFAEGTDPNEWTADPAADVKKGQTVTVTYTGSKKVIGVKAEKKGGAAGIVNPVVGQIIGSDGNNYDANATLPDGVTKVAMIAYVSGSNGLALALTDEGIYTWDNSSPSNNGKTAPEICSALNTSKAVTGGTWKLPSKDEWKQMFSANGGNEGSYTGLNTAIGNAGGTALVENEDYWSSSEVNQWDAWLVNLSDGNANWDTYGKHYSRFIRACLAF